MPSQSLSHLFALLIISPAWQELFRWSFLSFLDFELCVSEGLNPETLCRFRVFLSHFLILYLKSSVKFTLLMYILLVFLSLGIQIDRHSSVHGHTYFLRGPYSEGCVFITFVKSKDFHLFSMEGLLLDLRGS